MEKDQFISASINALAKEMERAVLALQMLKRLKDGVCREKNVLLPVTLIERDTVYDVKLHKKSN